MKLIFLVIICSYVFAPPKETFSKRVVQMRVFNEFTGGRTMPRDMQTALDDGTFCIPRGAYIHDEIPKSVSCEMLRHVLKSKACYSSACS